jgi:hypothetical protein
MQNLMASLQNFDPQTRRRITKDPDSLKAFMEKAGWFVQETFTPGQMREIRKALENPAEQTLLRHSGIRVNTTSVEKGVSFKSREVGQRFRDLSADLASARFNEDPQRFAQAVQTHQNIYQELVQHVGNLRNIGTPDDEIIRMLSKSVPKKMVLDAVDGIYTPPQYDRPKPFSQLYDEIQAMDGPERTEAIQTLSLQQRYEYIKRVQRERQSGKWSERDKYISSLGVSNGERAQYIVQYLSLKGGSIGPELRDLKRKGIVSDLVLRQIIQLQQVQN